MLALPSTTATPNLQAKIRRAILSDRQFPRRPKPDVSPDLFHGWLLPALLAADSAMYGRWDYWADCVLTGELPDAPIPAMDWVDDVRTPARKMLEAALDSIPQHGGWQGWGGWQYFDYFLDWLLFGFGHQGQPELPPEPLGCAGASARLYQVFCLEAMLAWPHDYFGDILAENRYGRDLDFYPTPMPVSQFAVSVLGVTRTDTVSDPCCGTGRLLLVASNYSLRLYGQDISPTLIKATLVNGYLYAPWLVRPLPFLDSDQYDPAQSEVISDSLAAIGETRPDVAAYLNGSEHDPELQWRFEPVKKRRRAGANTNVESHAETVEILQGVLF